MTKRYSSFTIYVDPPLWERLERKIKKEKGLRKRDRNMSFWVRSKVHEELTKK